MKTFYIKAVADCLGGKNFYAVYTTKKNLKWNKPAIWLCSKGFKHITGLKLDPYQCVKVRLVEVE